MNPKKSFLVVAVFFFCLFVTGQTSKPDQNPGTLRAGISKIDITPDKQVMLYGYGPMKSEGIHDPLSARALVFENKGKKIVLVSSDLGSIRGEALSTIKKSILDKFKLEESELFLSVIHSHSSPVLSLNKESIDSINVTYTEVLNQKLLTIISEAFNNLKPVQTGFGVGYSPVGINRRKMMPDGAIGFGRNPYGPTDKEVLVMKIATPDGNPIGALYDFATHATSLGNRRTLVSGDVLGISAQFVEKILGKDIVSPVFAGASGNIDPWFRVLPGFNNEPGWIPEPVLLGTLLGEEVVTVFRSINELSPGGEIISSFSTIECPRKKKDADKNRNKEEAQSTTIPVNITAARVGDEIVFIGFNVEMLTEIGLAIKASSPFKHTFIITHCNGYSGYLVPAGLYKEGGYEVNTSPFEIGSAEMVVKKSLRMLYDLK